MNAVPTTVVLLALAQPIAPPPVPHHGSASRCEALDAAGEPPEADARIEVSFVPIPGTNLHVGVVIRDPHPTPAGNPGPTPIPGEQCIVRPVGGGAYTWVNARGAEGSMARLPNGYLGSFVHNGQHARTGRILRP